MTTITLHHTTAELRAAVTAAKARPSDEVTEAERITINLADQLLAMIEEGGAWRIDDRGVWVEIEQLDVELLDAVSLGLP